MYFINYPDFKNHQIQHFDLLEEFNLARYNEQGFIKFYEFIRDWFINHTINEDKKLKEFILHNNIDIDSLHFNISL